MIVPSQAPMPITRDPSLSANAWTKLPLRSRYQAPVNQVASAAHRNQNRARGATYLVIPAPPGPPLSAAATPSAGICTTLKYHNNPIHITPERMCSQRARPNSSQPFGVMTSMTMIATTNPEMIEPRTELSGFINQPSQSENL